MSNTNTYKQLADTTDAAAAERDFTIWVAPPTETCKKWRAGIGDILSYETERKDLVGDIVLQCRQRAYLFLEADDDTRYRLIGGDGRERTVPAKELKARLLLNLNS